MSTRAKFLIVFFLLVILAGVGLFFTFRFRRIPDNETSVAGNTPGNAYNNGLFAEQDGVVYFANPSDSNCLYSMNADETGLKKLSRMGARNINVAGEYLYYYLDRTHTGTSTGVESVGREYGIYRSRINGKNQKNLLRTGLRYMTLGGNYIYFMAPNGNGGDLHKIRIDKADDAMVMSGMVNPSCYVNGTIYYAGVDNSHALFALDTVNGDTTRQVIAGNITTPIVSGDTVYYLDADRDYCLCRMNLFNPVPQVLTYDRVDTFNLNNQYIYYATSTGNAIRQMRLDGSENITLMNGIYNSIHVTSRYLYFKPYGDDYTVYHMPIGGGMPSVFAPGTE